MMVLWLLVLRGVSIEFRSHDANPLWRRFWDGGFALSSAVIAIVLGASLGNLVRGVPLDSTGWFRMPLFTDFRASGTRPGALDWYTVTVGLFALAALGGHGALYLRWKTAGAVHERSARLAKRLWIAIAALLVVVTIATGVVRPSLISRALGRPMVWLLGVAALGSLAGVFIALARGRERGAFVCSAGFLASLLAGVAASLFPVILRSTIAPAFDVTAANAANANHGLAVGLMWWVPALLLAVGYFAYLFGSLRGKVRTSESGHY
jgi:cytochrome d ubiquinol oxidase subunit II